MLTATADSENLPATSAAPPQTTRERHRVWNRRLIVKLLLFLLGLAAGVLMDRLAGRGSVRPPETDLPATAEILKPGPWGKLAKVPISISAPEEILPIRSIEAGGTRWFFGGLNRAGLEKLLDEAGVNVSQSESLMASATENASGLQVTPRDDVLLELAPDARLQIYRKLSRFPENRTQVSIFAAAALAEGLKANPVSATTESLLRQVGCEDGNRFILSGLAVVLARTADYAEKVRLMKALTTQKTFLLRFHMGPDSDRNSMSDYWGRGLWSTDIKTILSSLSRIPGGAWSSTLLLLPPLPTGLLYTYPLTGESGGDGAPVARDCHWTSFNFFRDQPDPRCTSIAYIKEKLAENYRPIVGDPRYGDIVFFARPDGSVIHSAVYLADDIVFTKNGDTYVHPWMLSTIDEVRDYYAVQMEPDEKLTLTFYRNKYN